MNIETPAAPWHARPARERRRTTLLRSGHGALALAALLALPAAPVAAAGRQAPPGQVAPAVPPAQRSVGARSGSEWFSRGMKLHEDERWDDAIAAFQKAFDAGYREGTASYNIACGYARKGDADRAFEWLGRALEAGFDVPSHLDDDDLASLHADPRWTDLKARARAARAGRDQARVKTAVARFEKLMGDPVKNGSALYDVGRELLRAAEYDRAARAFVAAAEAGRREGTSLYNAACARALANQRDEALGLLRRALDAGFDDPDHLREDDDLDGLRPDPRFAQLLKDAEELSLDGFPSVGGRLLRSQRVAEAEEAAARFERYLKKHPASGRAWSNLGFAHLAAEKDREALAAWRKALELGYRRPATMYNLACAHARLKERDEAFAWLDKAIDARAVSASHLEGDDDLWNLRRDPRFRKGVEKAKAAESREDDE